MTSCQIVSVDKLLVMLCVDVSDEMCIIATVRDMDGLVQKDVTPVQKQWGYVFLALTHRYGVTISSKLVFETSLLNPISDRCISPQWGAVMRQVFPCHDVILVREDW